MLCVIRFNLPAGVWGDTWEPLKAAPAPVGQHFMVFRSSQFFVSDQKSY